MTEAAVGVERAACGLSTFLLKPKDLKGEALFKHTVQHFFTDSRAKIHTPSVYLNIEHSEAQVKELGPDAKDVRKCSIVRYAHGDRATMKPATWKLDNLGYAKSYCSIHNNPERIRCLRNWVEFTQSLTTIAVLEQKDVAQGKADLVQELWAMGPAAKIKLYENNNNVSKLTKKEFCG
jgi:hypothetical protein